MSHVVAECDECGEETVIIPVKDWIETHDKKSGTTEWIPLLDKGNVRYNCDCDHSEQDLDQPEITEYHF